MHGSAKTEFEPVRTGGLNDFGCHAGPTGGTTFHAVMWRNLNDGMSHVGRDATMRRVSPIAIGAFDASTLCISLD
jgi:hypothetical protein